MQDKLIEAAQHVVDEMERGYPILGAGVPTQRSARRRPRPRCGDG